MMIFLFWGILSRGMIQRIFFVVFQNGDACCLKRLEIRDGNNFWPHLTQFELGFMDAFLRDEIIMKSLLSRLLPL